MRWIGVLPLFLLAACMDRGVSGDHMTLCERDPLCAGHPLPDGQNGIEWTPQGGAKNAGKPATSAKR